MRVLIFDTETSGLPKWKEPSDSPIQPRMLEIAAELWAVEDGDAAILDQCHYLVNHGPDLIIEQEAADLHGLTHDVLAAEGVSPAVALDRFFEMADGVDFHVAHNATFDIRQIRIESAHVSGNKWDCPKERKFCTMYKSMGFVRAPRTDGKNGIKTPTLPEAMRHFWPDEAFIESHRAHPDMVGARRLFFKLAELKPELLLITETV